MTKAKNTNVRKNQDNKFKQECPKTWLCFEISTNDYAEMSNHTHRANTESQLVKLVGCKSPVSEEWTPESQYLLDKFV